MRKTLTLVLSLLLCLPVWAKGSHSSHTTHQSTQDLFHHSPQPEPLLHQRGWQARSPAPFIPGRLLTGRLPDAETAHTVQPTHKRHLLKPWRCIELGKAIMEAKLDSEGFFKSKLEEVATTLMTVMVDMLLLLFWLVVEYSLSTFSSPKLPIHGETAKISMWLFRVLFAFSTVTPAVIFMFKDIQLMLVRFRIRRRPQRAELELSDIKQELLVHNRFLIVIFLLTVCFEVLLGILSYVFHVNRTVSLSLMILSTVTLAVLWMITRKMPQLYSAAMK